MRYALIKNNIIENIIEAQTYPESQIAATACGCDLALDVDLFNVAIGDSYIDGVFFRNGEIVQRKVTPEQELAELKSIVADLTAIVLGV